jgi:peptidoglycan/xylan/chitin deacetylase (PgdA/CDA1 family)/folate-dependent phosphoribosylglycinamide formyltransferase PurN
MPVYEPFEVAVLVGRNSTAARQAIESVAQLPHVKIAAVLLDTARPPLSRRAKNLQKNVRRSGLRYLPARFLESANERLDALAAKVVSQDEVQTLLHRAFPDRCFSLEELAERFGFAVHRVENLNSPDAANKLRVAGAHLGVVLGTRILKRSTFAVPPLGCINLHKGKVPEYRGMPPAFWELYEGCPTAGVTVHFVDDHLDTGDIVGSCEVAVHPNETEQSLRTKLDIEGARLLAQCVAKIQEGTATPVPQSKLATAPRTMPTRKQRQELRRRYSQTMHLPGAKQLAKTVLYLGFYHLGLCRILRSLRKASHKSRAAVLLYHRVNDYSTDVLTTSTQGFAEHLCVLKKFYKVRSSNWLVDALKSGQYISPDTVVIHFDDCYSEVLHNAGPILHACNAPATSFIASGFVGTNRAFEHDLKKYPFKYSNFTVEDVRALPRVGIEVGAHTVNHVNLGDLPLEAARTEVFNSRSQLEAILGQRVLFFSFPFGRLDNICEEVRAVVMSAGYDAMFSAHGGFVNAQTDRFDIPRSGVSSLHRPIDLIMEIEGLSLGNLVKRLHFLPRNKGETAVRPPAQVTTG